MKQSLLASMRGRRLMAVASLLVCAVAMSAQDAALTDGLQLDAEISGTVSSGDNAPLWLSGNRHGLVSPYGNSAYERAFLHRDIAVDSTRQWKRGYGVDIMLSQNAQSQLFVHQAYAQVGWMKAMLTVGAKERGTDLRNDELTSGGLSHGTNAAPIPMVMGEMDYFSIPHTDHWWKWRGRLGYGMTTDGSWQKDWVYSSDATKYTSNVLYHEKALYWKFGREDKFPLTYEIGIQMMALFGGTSYNVEGRGLDGPSKVKNPADLNAFWHAFSPIGSSDVTDGVNQNAAGNTLGSYNMRLQWTQRDDSGQERWSVGAYFERFFEDHSMLTLQYGIYDHLIGIDAYLPRNQWVSHLLVEHISTKDQSGAVYHDGTTNMPDALAGRDNYYNHHMYSGWQHWGMAIGNPLITSPVFNANHQLKFLNNRIQAWHIGLDGDPCSELHWTAKASFSRNWGTYHNPFKDVEDDQHYMLSVQYTPKWAEGWSGTLATGLTHSAMIGNTVGAQVTVRRTFGF